VISILIPTYNRPNQLKKNLLSLRNQSLKNFRVIISDNSENDISNNIVKEFKDLNITYIKNYKNLGSKKNFLNLLSKVKTNFYCYLLDDDYFCDKNYLLEVSKIINQNPQIGLIYSGRQLYNHTLKKIYKKMSTNIKNFNSASEWVYKRDSKLVFNFSGVVVAYDNFYKEIIKNDPGAGWGADDLGFIFAAKKGVNQLSGISVTITTNVNDSLSKDVNLKDWLLSSRKNRDSILKVLYSENKKKYNMKAIRKINVLYSDWKFFASEGVKIFKSKIKNKNNFYFKQIKNNFVDFNGILFYLPKIIVIIILNLFK
jgi:glycosyltransferase involved in cell wall biosynthesis